MRGVIFFICALLLVPAGAVQAGESMRCGVHLIRAGDTKAEVLKRCGKPAYREVVSGADEPLVEQWYYELGSTRFPKLLTFRGFKVTRVETLTRE